MISVLIRSLVYASVFIGVLLVYLPARTLAWAGMVRPDRFGAVELVGAALTVCGAALAVWCILTFVVLGRGTPAPFDPPRRLVVRGPYRYLRNPMYLGAGLALGGAALVYRSPALLAYAGAFLVVMHLFVLTYEEPTLRRAFGEDYQQYCRRVHRWWPQLRA